ncbi:MAG: glycosyltransferase [Spirochaetes bacterium]|nr:glycosyltransferase [Spirochaetota bacterium]
MTKSDILIFSSLPKNSGCFLRARYLTHSLKKNGLKAKMIIPSESVGFLLDFILSFFKNLAAVFTHDFKVGMAIKPYPNTLIPLLIKKMLFHTRIIVDIDDIDFGYRKGMINHISRLIQKPFPRFFDTVTFHNPALKKFITREYRVKKNKLYSLLQGVDFDVYRIKRSIRTFKIRLKRRLSLSRAKIMIYTAHLNIASDLDIILQNIAPLLEKRDYFLIVAGGGPLLSFFKDLSFRLNIKKIFFTGYQAPEEIVKYVLASDLAIVYYKKKEVNFYRSSMKLREYLALCKRVVSNDIGELKNFRRFVYQSASDIGSFIKRIDHVLGKNISDGREKNGYWFVKKNYDWLTIGKGFKQALSQFL